MSGLQCWDASGKLIVDIGDYNCRYLGAITVNKPAGTSVVTGAFSGLTQNGSFGFVSAVSDASVTPSSLFVRNYDGGFRLFDTSSSSLNYNVAIQFYGFL